MIQGCQGERVALLALLMAHPLLKVLIYMVLFARMPTVPTSLPGTLPGAGILGGTLGHGWN
jgi:hypothetical protein